MSGIIKPMPSTPKHAVILGGPNGAGKTTFAKEYLPKFVHIDEFVNADNIAAGLSPFNRDAVAMEAGRLMLARIQTLIDKGLSFGFETTLAGLAWQKVIVKLKNAGYNTSLFYLNLSTEALSKERVRTRVAAGGHDIPEETLERRFVKSKQNFWEIYRGLVDEWFIFDVTQLEPKLVASGNHSEIIYDQTLYDAWINQVELS